MRIIFFTWAYTFLSMLIFWYGGIEIFSISIQSVVAPIVALLTGVGLTFIQEMLIIWWFDE